MAGWALFCSLGPYLAAGTASCALYVLTDDSPDEARVFACLAHRSASSGFSCSGSPCAGLRFRLGGLLGTSRALPGRCGLAGIRRAAEPFIPSSSRPGRTAAAVVVVYSAFCQRSGARLRACRLPVNGLRRGGRTRAHDRGRWRLLSSLPAGRLWSDSSFFATHFPPDGDHAALCISISTLGAGLSPWLSLAARVRGFALSNSPNVTPRPHPWRQTGWRWNTIFSGHSSRLGTGPGAAGLPRSAGCRRRCADPLYAPTPLVLRRFLVLAARFISLVAALG